MLFMDVKCCPPECKIKLKPVMAVVAMCKMPTFPVMEKVGTVEMLLLESNA
jgi:hypothetical protein